MFIQWLWGNWNIGQVSESSMPTPLPSSSSQPNLGHNNTLASSSAQQSRDVTRLDHVTRPEIAHLTLSLLWLFKTDRSFQGGRQLCWRGNTWRWSAASSNPAIPVPLRLAHLAWRLWARLPSNPNSYTIQQIRCLPCSHLFDLLGFSVSTIWILGSKLICWSTCMMSDDHHWSKYHQADASSTLPSLPSSLITSLTAQVHSSLIAFINCNWGASANR